MKTFVGRVTKDATVNTTKNNKEVVNFSIAENHSYTTKEGERKKETTFYNCAFWRSTGIAKHLTKGTLVELFGNLNAEAYTDKNGQPKASLRIHVSEIILLTGNKQDKGNKQPVTQNEEEAPADDMPF